MQYYMATKDMMDDIVRMRLEYIKAELGSLTEDEEQNMRTRLPVYYEEHLDKDYIVFFAQEDAEIVGCACLHIISRPCRPQYAHGLIGEVLNVITLDAYKRRGIASELMKLVMEEGQKRGLDYITLEATEDGAPLYEKLGWERSATYTPMEYQY